MIGLNASLTMATQSLQAEDGAIAVTNNNIANVNTTGYSRQVVDLSAAALVQNGTSVDAGVSYDGFTSVRDQLLQLAVNQQTSSQSSLDAQSTALTQIQTAFSDSDSGVGTALSTFFSSVSSLSTDPTDSSARQSVLSAASQLANAFHQASSALTTAESNADSQVNSAVDQINTITTQIAKLNGQISSIEASGQDGGAIEDQRDELTTQLAALTGISETQTGGAPTLTTASGSPLVIGNTAYALTVTRGSDGLAHVTDSSGNDITSKLSGGSIGSAVSMRDTIAPSMLTQLDTLASQFATAVNAAQAEGTDQTGATGAAMFSTTSTVAGSAASITVALSSATAIAASSDGTSGSSGNVANLLAVQTSTLASGQTPTDAYASLVYKVGDTASTTTSDLNAANLSLQQLTSQQSSTSGVSVDEETTNLIRFQQAYTAAAKVVSTINDLFTVVANMVGA